MVYFTADQHFGEHRTSLMGRPFASAADNDDAIVAMFKRTVSPGDTVYFAGDVTCKASPESISVMDKLPRGRRVLFRGNHDRVHDDAVLSRYFDEVHPEGCLVRLPLPSGLRVAVNHYPSRGAHDVFNLVGHIHAAWKVQLNQLNVGVDVWHFMPVSAARVQFEYDAICGFYDDDCWAAYSQTNAPYRATRGKKGTYLP